MSRRLIIYCILVSLALTLLSIFLSHWCSDVIASIAIAAAITLLFIWLFRMQPAQVAREAARE